VRKLIGVSVIATLAFVFTGGPAQATGTSGKMNLYKDDNYSGCHLVVTSYVRSLGDSSCGTFTAFNDSLSSFANNTPNWWIFYLDINYSGTRLCVRPNSHDNNIGNDTAYEDDISSVEKVGSTQPTGCADVTGTAN
jgi:peptidase inhibitor family I36